ncbi:MAG: rhodanese-like domain-containing protein [Myxococcota bacterium]
MAAVIAFVVVRSLLGASSSAGAEGEQWVAEGAVLVDVRTSQEFEQGHLEGAVNIPVQELESRSAELDPKRPVVVYCQKGGRAGRAKTILEGKGFEKVLNGGGIGEWKR